MSRRASANFIVAVVSGAGLVGCSTQSPVTPSAFSTAVQPPSSLAALGAPGSYDLEFLSTQRQPVSCLIVGGPELVLHAHVLDGLGLPAPSGKVTFEYCSLRGRPNNDITRPDEAPSSACEVEPTTGDWASLHARTAFSEGDAYAGFPRVNIPRVIGFRFKYAGPGTGIAHGTSMPRNFTWKTDCTGVVVIQVISRGDASARHKAAQTRAF